MIACSMPGKIGDALYALPTVRKLSESYSCKVDFYTSEHCRPIVDFLKNQIGINDVIIPPDYKIERYDLGVQPWKMPIDESKYDNVFQLGFKSVPDKSLPEFIAESAGLDRTVGKNIHYDITMSAIPNQDYFVIAPRGNNQFFHFFEELICTSDYNFMIIGGEGDNPFPVHPRFTDVTGDTFMNMALYTLCSKGFIGLMSAPLVIANGFNTPKYIPYTEYQWDMRHIVERPESKYVTNYSVADCINWITKENM